MLQKLRQLPIPDCSIKINGNGNVLMAAYLPRLIYLLVPSVIGNALPQLRIRNVVCSELITATVRKKGSATKDKLLPLNSLRGYIEG